MMDAKVPGGSGAAAAAAASGQNVSSMITEEARGLAGSAAPQQIIV